MALDYESMIGRPIVSFEASGKIGVMVFPRSMVTAVRGDAFVVDPQQIIEDAWEGRMTMSDEPVELLYAKRNFEAVLKGERPDAIVGISSPGEKEPVDFRALSVPETITRGLRGQGRPDLWFLIIEPVGQVNGKDVRDGAISQALLRHTRLAIIAQGTQQNGFAGGVNPSPGPVRR